VRSIGLGSLLFALDKPPARSGVITPDDLRAAKCDHCQGSGADCQGIHIHARCHPTAGLDVAYHHGEDALRIVCKQCGRHVQTILLGSAKDAS
jgi:hypothetical protein